MSLIQLENIISIFIIAVYFFGVSFAWLLPLYLWLKKSVLAVQFVVPVSLSLQILFQYIFYTFEVPNYSIIPYLVIVLFVNVWSIKRIGMNRLKSKAVTFLTFVSWKNVAISLFFLTLVLFSRFYDSFSTLAPGNNDTYNHIVFLKNVRDMGYISVTYYAPGFHLLVLPLTYVLPYSELYRFVGPVIGVLTALTIFSLVKPALRNRYSKYVLLALLCFPIFNQFILQTIGFFSSSLTFIYMTAFLMLLGFSNNRTLPHRYGMTLLLTIALAVTVPYFFVQYSVALLILLITTFVIRKLFTKTFVIRLAVMCMISLLGIAVGYVHVLLQTSVHSSSYFPTLNETTTIIQNDRNSSIFFLEYIFEIPFVSTSVVPLLSAGIDVVKVKAVRSPDNILALGAYGWIAISAALAVYAGLSKKRSLLVLSTLSLVYGVITQTGMVEMTTYKGRSGWYLLLLGVLGSTFYFDRIAVRVSKRYSALLVSLLTLSVLLTPPVHYRPYHEEQFSIVDEYIEKHEPNVVYAFLPELSLLADNVKVVTLSEEVIAEELVSDSIVVLDKVIPEIDPVLSQQASVMDKEYSNFRNKQELRKNDQLLITNYIISSDYCIDEFRHKETELTIVCVK